MIAAIKPRSNVELVATKQLLFVERVDSAAGVAFCKEYGPNGPKGVAKPYPLADLRVRTRRAIRVAF